MDIEYVILVAFLCWCGLMLLTTLMFGNHPDRGYVTALFDLGAMAKYPLRTSLKVILLLTFGLVEPVARFLYGGLEMVRGEARARARDVPEKIEDAVLLFLFFVACLIAMWIIAVVVWPFDRERAWDIANWWRDEFGGTWR